MSNDGGKGSSGTRHVNATMVPIHFETFPDVGWMFEFIGRFKGYGLELYDPEQRLRKNMLLGFIHHELLRLWCESEGLVDINLFPDMSRAQYTKNDTFVFAAPITTKNWIELQRHARRTGEGVGYLLAGDFPNLEDVIILRDPHLSDDDCMVAQAYVRMVHKANDRVYCVSHQPRFTTHDLIEMTTGAPRALCKMVTLEIKEDDTQEKAV